MIRSSTSRILVIEDDESTRTLLGEMLRHHGYDVETAASGPSGLCAFLSCLEGGKRFDALLLDCAMAPMDGFVVARTIRLWESEIKRMQRTLIGFFTAYSRTVEQTTLLKSVGADAYFRKPEDVEKLPELVSAWLASAVSEAVK
jgi:two-component system response regulator RegX3